jgi:predicted ATPase
MSDGTLRALGVLTALYQSPNGGDPVPLIGIEEPEVALHPAAAGVLFDCLQEAAASRQVIVTSHSADLLDRHDIPIGSLLAVNQYAGKTVIAQLDKAGRMMLKKKLRTPGELLRMNQITPELPPEK